MGRKTRISKGKQMKPNFFVFCEGETEIAYVKFLRSLYRAPIQVIAKKGKSNISEDYIERSQNEYVRTEQDKVFLMYDLDVPSVLERLKKIPDATLLCSNPCFELWLLLHATERKSEINTDDVIKELRKSLSIWKNYKKSEFTKDQQTFLLSNMVNAINRAKGLKEFQIHPLASTN